MSRVLLHTCCGPCATHCLRVLRAEGHTPVLFFSNSNIAPAAEYARRLEAVKQLAAIESVEWIEDPPDHERWLKEVAQGYETCAEGGERCLRCFRFSLSRAARALEQTGCEAFTTSLSVSPHKRSATLFDVARSIAPDHFLPYNFKKQNGFQESLRLSAAYSLYRQNDCGCEFSKRPREKENPSS